VDFENDSAKDKKVKPRLDAKGHAGFSDLDTGDITITPDAIEVDQLTVPEIKLDKLDITSGTGLHESTVKATPGVGDVRLTGGVEVKVHIDRKSGEITLKHMLIPQIVAQEIHADIDGVGSFYIPPPGTPAKSANAVLETVSLDGLKFDSSLAASGSITIDKSTIPQLHAAITRKFTGDLLMSAGKITVDLSANNLRRVAVADPHAQILGKSGAELSPGQTLKGTADAKSILYRNDPGAAPVTEIEGASVSDLVYEDTIGGVTVKVLKGTIPGTTTVHNKDGVIPELDISEADVHVDFTKSSGGAKTYTMTPSTADLLDILFDDVDGTVPLSVLLQGVKTVRPYDRRDIRMHIDLAIRNGVLDFNNLLAQAQRTITFTPSAAVLSGASHSLLGWSVDGNAVSLSVQIPVETDYGMVYVPVSDIVTWHLKHPADVTAFQTAQTMRLPTVIDDYFPGPGGGNVEGIQVTLDPTPDLAVKNRGPIWIDFSGTPSGHVTLSPNVVSGVSAQGTIIAVPTAGGPTKRTLTDITVKDFGVDNIALTVSGTKVSTDGIKITDATRGSLTMDTVHPQVLDLHVKSAVAHNIKWTLP
jgi:hypothetical protein